MPDLHHMHTVIHFCTEIILADSEDARRIWILLRVSVGFDKTSNGKLVDLYFILNIF